MKANLFLIGILFSATNLVAQVGIGTTSPSNAAMLEVSSTADEGTTYKGFMPPRVADIAVRDEIPVSAADDGLVIYIRDSGCLQIWNGISWENIHCNNSSALATDLFISEYVEGSSNNKVIEIANFTGSPKVLDYYKLAIYHNGSSTASPISFIPSFTLDAGEVYVIKHAGADALIVADQTSNTLDFNGNDAVVLESSTGAVIDILGEVGDARDYAKNKTLRRKPTIGPYVTYIPSNFLVLGIDDFSGLGSHTY